MSKFLSLGVLVATGLGTAAAIESVSVTDLGRLGGASFTYARAVNGAGDVTGYGVVPMSYQFCDTRTRTVKTSSSTVPRSYVKTASGVIEPIGTYAVAGAPEYVKRSVAVGIGDAGQVIGTVSVPYASTCFSPTGPAIWFASERAATWTRSGGWSLLPLPASLPAGQWSSYAYASNRSGDAAGWAPFVTASGEVAYSGALWRQGSVVPVGTPASDRFSYAYGVNERQQVVGQLQTLDAATGGWKYSAYVWSPQGGMVTLPTPQGGDEASARAINERGDVLVSYSAAAAGGPQTRFLVWTPDSPNGSSGRVADVSAPAGGSILDVTGISEEGHVYGSIDFDGSGGHAALWVDGSWHNLDAAGAQPGSGAYAMNRTGALVGDRNGVAVLWQVEMGGAQPPADAATGLSVSGAAGTYGGQVTLSATLSAAGAPLAGKAISFRLNGAPVATATTNALGTASISAMLAGIAAGSYPGAVEASFAAESGYLASSESASLTVARAGQEITFAELAGRTYGDAPVALSASASSGLPVSFGASGVCSVDGALLSITGAGSCTVTATQPGDGNREPASAVTRAFSVAKASPLLAWSVPAPVAQGTLLGADQLNAAAAFGGAALPGSYAYTPASGAALPRAGSTELTVVFTPADSGNFNAVEARVALQVTNVAPQLHMGPGAKLLPGESFSSAGSFVDPGADVWTGSVSYGDGPSEPLALDGGAFALQHVYRTAGQYTVQVTVTDEHQGVGTGSVAVVVQTPVEAVRDLAAQLSTSLGLSSGQSKALSATLEATISSLNARRANVALVQLNAFSLQIDALVRSGRITPARGQEMKGFIDRLSRAIRSAGGM